MKLYDLPDAQGHFGQYGGTFVAETLIEALDQLKAQYARYQGLGDKRATVLAKVALCIG